jgi:hypothetical protein
VAGEFAAVQRGWRDFRIAQSSSRKAIQPCRIIGRAFVNQHAVVNKFSRVKPDDTEFTGGGLRDFFRYRDLGISLKYLDWRVS